MRILIAAGVLVLLVVPPLLVRFRPRWVTTFNLAVTNRIIGPFATSLPGFGIITHVGRKSGRSFRTPVKPYRCSGGFLIALTYGPESQWVQNILASGRADLETRHTRYSISSPLLVHDPTRKNFSLPVRIILGILGAHDFLQVSASHESK
jgi:deazaflavin-dependent oxidoreductase (nitroreductase family)